MTKKLTTKQKCVAVRAFKTGVGLHDIANEVGGPNYLVKRYLMRNGVIKGQAGILWKMARKIILWRDGGACQKCGQPFNKMDVNHVKSKGKHPELYYDLTNLILFCSHCHLYWWHADVTDAAQWFAETYPARLRYLDDIIKSPKNETMNLDYYYKIYKQLDEKLKEIS